MSPGSGGTAGPAGGPGPAHRGERPHRHPQPVGGHLVAVGEDGVTGVESPSMVDGSASRLWTKKPWKSVPVLASSSVAGSPRRGRRRAPGWKIGLPSAYGETWAPVGVVGHDAPQRADVEHRARPGPRPCTSACLLVGVGDLDRHRRRCRRSRSGRDPGRRRRSGPRRRPSTLVDRHVTGGGVGADRGDREVVVAGPSMAVAVIALLSTKAPSSAAYPSVMVVGASHSRPRTGSTSASVRPVRVTLSIRQVPPAPAVASKPADPDGERLVALLGELDRVSPDQFGPVSSPAGGWSRRGRRRGRRRSTRSSCPARCRSPLVEGEGGQVDAAAGWGDRELEVVVALVPGVGRQRPPGLPATN
jgi:hypothetical protein